MLLAKETVEDAFQDAVSRVETASFRRRWANCGLRVGHPKR